MTQLCPNCRDILAEDAKACSCGWIAPAAKKPRVNWHDYEVIKPTENNFRRKWREYCEAKGLCDREPPLWDCGFLRCVGGSLVKRLESGELGPAKGRQREPGDDDEEVAA